MTTTRRRRKPSPAPPHLTGEQVAHVARTGQPCAVTDTWDLTADYLVREVPDAEWLPHHLALTREAAEAVAFRLNQAEPWASL